MLRTSSDKWFWYDASPDYKEYLNTPWSNLDAPIMESMQELIEAFKPAAPMFDSIVKKWSPAYSMVVDEDGKVWSGFQPGGVIPHIQTVFTDEMTEIEGPSGPDTHDDRGRPRLGPSGGVPRPTSLCPRHGLPMHGGWCRRCQR